MSNGTAESTELSPGIATAIVLPILVVCFVLLVVVAKLRVWMLKRREARILIAAVNAPRPIQRETKEHFNYDWTLQNLEDEELRERRERLNVFSCFCIYRSSKVHPMVIDDEELGVKWV
jgi:hypothetical protein